MPSTSRTGSGLTPGSMRTTRTPKTSERVARELVNHIVENKLVEGTKLPNEKQLVDVFDVGRTTLREALRLLETRIEEQPLLSSWDALGDYLQATMAHRRTEEVRILFLNAKNMLIANEALWQGSVDEASVHVREVIARAIALGATALIIVHNHPSGDPTPSSQDIRLTRDLVEAGRHMKITVHDHVIVGARGRTSMRAMGLI